MNQKKKIIHFHPNGKFAFHFVRPLMEAERKAGYISSIVVSANAAHIDAIQIPFDLNLKNIYYLFPTFLRIYKLLLRERPDVLISHNSKSSSLVLICAMLAKVPQRVYFNHGVPFIAYKGLIKHVLKLLEFINLYFSTQVITVSEDMLVILKRLYSKKAIHIINSGSACGLDLPQYGIKKYQNSTFRIEHKINQDDFLLVFIGRPEKRKGFNLTVEMWVKYFSIPKYKLVLCGPTQFDVLEILGFLPDNIICLGFNDKVPEILSQSDLLILPSYHEGLPYAVLEAMASGCLVVASNIDGIRNLVQNKFNGFLVENNDATNYAEVIYDIKSEAMAYKNIIKRNAIHTANKYSRDTFMMSYLAHFD